MSKSKDEKMNTELSILTADYLEGIIKVADKYGVDRNYLLKINASVFASMVNEYDYSNYKNGGLAKWKTKIIKNFR